MKNRGLTDSAADRILGRFYLRIDRGGCVYYARANYRYLNRREDMPGVGMHFVKADEEKDPTGVFFSSEIKATAEEIAEAMMLYREAVPSPAKEPVMVPASFFPRCIEDTATNRKALREAGAWWVKEQPRG